MHKTLLLFFFVFDTKFICYQPFLVVANKREIDYENKSIALHRQRKINCCEKRESRRRPGFTFSVVVFARACLGFCLHIFIASVGLLCWPHSKIGAVIFDPSSHHHILCLTDFLFWFSILHPLWGLSRLSFFKTNHSLPAICFNTFLFLTRVSIAIPS